MKKAMNEVDAIKNNDVKVNSVKAWWLAARPKTLTGAMIPVLLAGALAVHDGVFQGKLWLCCLGFASLMQIAANFINDLFDFLKGSDREDRLGPERACSQGWISPKAMRWGIAVVVTLACVLGLLTVWMAGPLLPYHGWEFIGLGALCVVFAFLYTTRLSYLGWGDVLVLVFFGFVPVCGTYYLLALRLSPLAFLLSLLAGIAIDALLMINNFRDRDQDRLSGKRTVVVRWGASAGLYAYLLIGVAASVLSFLTVGVLLYPTVISSGLTALQGLYLALLLIYPVLHVGTWLEMKQIDHGKALNAILGKTSRNMFLLALMVCIILILI